MSHPRTHLQLFLVPTGAAELRRGDRVLWSSQDDPEFRDRVNEEMLSEEDVDDVIDYLVDTNRITPEQAEALEGNVFEELDEDEEEPEPLEGELIGAQDEDEED